MPAPDPFAVARKKLVVALDGDSLVRAQELVDLLKADVRNFEIGMELFTACGPAAIKMIQENGGRAFLDLKYHDIPSTVAKAVGAAAKLGVAMINVHASGGHLMMEAARKMIAQLDLGASSPQLIAVTVLTSMESLADIGVQYEVRSQVVRLAKLAKEVGLDGVLASSLEIKAIRQACGKDFVIVTSGIRLPGTAADDQRRVGDPGQACNAGADYLVVGRPITEAPDPRAGVHAILKGMGT
ncbi:MAG: orotidine-5'-phosphate decarboxylase [Deltaproteobacteria bacterium]|nr:orotidine-5'-phosphate decarboxylase [Deltaproteobacteria bacterium]